MANPLGYPPKSAAFLQLQCTAGFQHEQYRRTGHSEIDPTNDPADAAAIAARTQPIAGIGAFAQGPAPGSAAARQLRDRSIANRGTVGSRTGIYREGYLGPDMDPLDQDQAEDTMNTAAVRARLLTSNLSFVRQLGWVSDAK